MAEVLVINAGSSSLKFALFGAGLEDRLSGLVAEIGGEPSLRLAGGTARPVQAADHAAALGVVLAAMETAGHPLAGLTAAGHRVVHGGRTLTGSCRIDTGVLAAIEANVALAPLHNPANLAGIRGLSALLPDLPQFACFDTAFHATNPEVALRYAIPAAEDAAGIRRYGFHGLSYASLVQRLPGLTGAPLPRRLLALHLGNGASLCAIRKGRSVATTMGYSPLEGLTMGTRAGGVDGNAVLRLAERHGIKDAARILNRESGLLALGGASDMRALAAAGTAQAEFARAHFAYWAVRHAGSMVAAMGGLDALVFTGGIGENDADIRARILSGLSFLGLVPDLDANRRAAGAARISAEGAAVEAWVIPAAEEAYVASETLSLMSATQARHI